MAKIGINIHPKARAGQEYSADEKVKLTEFLDELDADFILVMDNFEWAKAYAARLPKTRVIFRPYHPLEGELFNKLSARDYYIGRKEFQNPNLIMYVLNEPSTYTDEETMRRKIKWLVELMDLYAADKQPIVVDNVGVGHYDLLWFTDDHKWSIIKPLFDAFKRNPYAYWGLHEYFSYRGLEVGNGRVGRHKQMAQALAARGYDMPPVILTEVGCDQIDDSPHRGWRSSMNDLELGSYLVEGQTGTWAASYIKGILVYCYGSTTKEWWDFDIMACDRTKNMLIASNQTEDIPMPPPPPAINDRAPALIAGIQPLVHDLQETVTEIQETIDRFKQT